MAIMLETILKKISNFDNCWECDSSLSWSGYPQLVYQNGGKYTCRQAHRVLYEILVGEIPVGYQLDHVCKNKLCINPDHMEAVTPQENMMRRNAHITHCPSGHEYTEENIYKRPDGRVSRDCKKCRQVRRSSARLKLV